MDNGYILLARSILDSDVFASQKLLKIWVWCLCKANFKDRSVPLKIGKGETIVNVKRGSFIFGRNKAEEELFIDGSTIYKSMQKLELMDMIKIQSNNQFSIVTICKYNEYQQNDNYKVTSKEQPSNNQVTSKEQPSNTTNTLPNVKKDNNVKQINIPDFEEFKIYALDKKSNICLENLKLKYDSWIENGWKNGNGKEIKNWKANLLNTLPYIKEKSFAKKEIPQTLEDKYKHLL